MKHKIIITLEYEIATGKTNLNEIVYALKKVQDEIMLQTLSAIIDEYDREITTRLTLGAGASKKGLGTHYVNGNESQMCDYRKSKSRGFRGEPRHIKTAFGELKQKIRMIECKECGTRYSPLLEALKIDRFERKEGNLEQEVIEAVIDTNYRRLTEGISVDISLGGIHNIVVGSDIDKELTNKVETKKLQGIEADGTVIKQYRGEKGELRAVIGITRSGRPSPIGCFVNKSWEEIEQEIKPRIKDNAQNKIPFVYDGEPGLDNFLADTTETQRCMWHASRGLNYSLWNDGVCKRKRAEATDEVKRLIGIELPTEDYELLKKEDKQAVITQYAKSKKEMDDLINTFKKRGYVSGAAYLENLVKGIFTRVKIWFETGVISLKTTSLLERVFKELGRRLKKIAWGWSDKGALKMSQLILIKQYEPEKWKEYWLKKLGINGNFKVKIASVCVL